MSTTRRRSPEGFPDLVAVRPPRLLFIELKSETGKLTADQERWLADLRACKEANGMARLEIYVWWPHDRGAIAQVLR